MYRLDIAALDLFVDCIQGRNKFSKDGTLACKAADTWLLTDWLIVKLRLQLFPMKGVAKLSPDIVDIIHSFSMTTMPRALYSMLSSAKAFIDIGRNAKWLMLTRPEQITAYEVQMA